MAKSDEILTQLASLSAQQTHIVSGITELKEQDKLQSEEIKKIVGSVSKIDKRQAVLEVKAGLWGTIGGFASTLYMQIKHGIGL